jgi:AcrR family transcriptional regulator
MNHTFDDGMSVARYTIALVHKFALVQYNALSVTISIGKPAATMTTIEKIPNDLRERKRQLTLDRIAEIGLELFVENGYEATTLDAIAAAAGISRRTFFHYLKSKEDVLLEHESGKFLRVLRPTFLEQSPKLSPINAARKTFLALASTYQTKESIIADQILRSVETLRLRKEALFVQIEEVLAEAMYEKWPDKVRRPALRLAAITALGALRFAKDNWRQEAAAHPLTYHIDKAFNLLDEI